MQYSVYLTQKVSTIVEVEAESVEDALEKVYDSPDMPGSMTIGAFGKASVDESGEWTPVFVYDTSDLDEPLWER